MGHLGTILVVDDAPEDYVAIAAALSDPDSYRVLSCDSDTEALSILATALVDLVFCVVKGPRIAGLDLFGHLRVSHPDIPRLLIVRDDDQAALKKIIHDAAIYQYLTKPVLAEQAALVVKRALETRELSRRNRLLSRELNSSGDSPLLGAKPVPARACESSRFEKLVYASPQMAELCNLAKQAAKTELPILIQGGSGTGKELLARAIHFNSARRNSPLRVQNCGGMSEELLRSELFGHKRGAFAGAISDRLGLFQAADGGTAFLDEISEISPSLQLSMLRFLQGGGVKPLGSDRAEACDVRVIAACNRPLAGLVEKREFREDLYFRLKGFELAVPSLADRPADIPVLVEFFMRKHSAALQRRILGIANEAVERLAAHDYPGNVRELETEIRRMVAVAEDGEYLTVRHLSPRFARLRPRAASGLGANFGLSGASLKEMVETLEARVVS
jgi:two-component system response regulator HupR/HoxA